MKINSKQVLITLSSFAISIIVLISVHLNFLDISSDNSRQTYRSFLNESIVNHKIPPKERYFGSPAIKSVFNTDIHIITEIGTRIPYYQNTTSGLKPFNDINFPKIEINMPKLSSISWQQFTKYKRQEVNPNITKRQELVNILKNFKDQECPVSVVDELKKPRLQPKDFAWCQWALSDEGAKVIVGKSWGKLDKKEMLKFDALNCNTVKAGKNPSCDDSWGDEALRKWIRTPQETVGCDNGKKSKVQCYKNDNLDSYCEIENAQIDFSKWRTVKRAGNTDSKSFSQDFLSADCNGKSTEPQFPFPHLYSPILSSTKCDYVHNGTVVLYSHDDIRNLGHTLNDIMNVWVMLWLGRVGTNSDQLNLLNIDSFKLGHNWLDKPNVFFNIYRHNFHQILKGVDFSDKTLCVQKLLIQPIPPRFFIWESWFIDLPCSFTGPSSLYQRYNVIVRDSYGLLPREKGTAPSDLVLKVLLVVRKVYTNLWGNNRSSRNYLNLPAIISSLEKVMASSQILYRAKIKFNLAAIDLNDLSFDEQMKLLGETSIIVGMHGAG
jgi:hypothetical protein